MSQAINTVLESCGLMVGWNIAPPPPGPMMRKSPGRSAAAPAKHTATRIAGRKRNFIGPCLMMLQTAQDAPPMVQPTWKRPPVNLVHDEGGRFLDGVS